jgi:AAA domain
VYVALNPTVPSLLARCANRVKPRAATTTSDKDILQRRWMLVDCDPVRPSEISSTDVEHEAALERARDIRMVLREEKGWPTPLLADSGNGGHLLYAVDLPNDDAATALVKAVLTALATRFDNAVVKIDQAVFNAARIVKCYGTVAGKGDDIPERPHRLSRIIDAPAQVEAVSRELLEELVTRWLEAQMPQAISTPESSDSRSRFDIDAFIAKHLSAREPVAHEGGRKWVMESCPFNPEHKAPDAAVFERPNGSLAFKCFHNSCAGMAWKDVREKFEPRQNRQEKKQGAARSASPRLQPPKLLNYGELKGIETPMQRPLFDGYPLPARGATLLFGQSKAGKTILALQVALAIARGKPLFDYYSLSQKGAGGVLVVEQDDPDGAAGIRDLVERSGGGPLDMPFYLVPRVPFSFGPAFLDWLEKEITSRKLVLLRARRLAKAGFPQFPKPLVFRVL